MLTLLVLTGLFGYGVYTLGSLAAKHPDATVGVGKLVLGLFKK